MAVTCVILYSIENARERGVGRWVDRSNVGASLVVVGPFRLEEKFVSGVHQSSAWRRCKKQGPCHDLENGH